MSSRLPVDMTALSPGDIPLADGSWVTPLLDTSLVAIVLQEQAELVQNSVTSCVVKHVRYRPGAACTVLYEVGLTGNISSRSLWVYGKVTAPGRELPATAALNSGAGAHGCFFLKSPLSIEVDRTVFYEFPMDPFLPSITRVSDPEAFGRDILECAGFKLEAQDSLFVEIKPLRYKPEHRLIMRVRIDLEKPIGEKTQLWDGLVRFEHGVNHQRRRQLVQTLQDLLIGQDEVTVPDPETYLPGVGCSINTWKPGEDLARKIRKGKFEAGLRAGQALARIHQLSQPDMPDSGATEAFAILRRQVETFVQNSPAPGLADDYCQAMSALIEPADDRPICLVHGDFHQGQLLAQGERTCILDWDRAHLGDPMEDFGRFQAQIHLLELRGKVIAAPLLAAFGKGYLERGGQMDPVGETFWTGLALIDLGLREVRRQRSGWEMASRKILARANLVSEGRMT